MTVIEFARKAYEGGWQPNWIEAKMNSDGFEATAQIHVHKMLLNPEAWKACGKVEGWEEHDSGLEYPVEWINNMHKMVSALVEGKSIEEFLKNL